MSKPQARNAQKATDGIQQRITEYVHGLRYEDLTPEALRAAKLGIVDILGAVAGGFSGEPCRIARELATQMPMRGGATVLGTRMKTTPEMAAYANGTAALYAELMDVYHWPGSFGGHPSSTVTPILAAAEHVHVSGRDFMTAVIGAYEIYAHMSDAFKGEGFANTNFCCIGTAVGAGKVLGLTPAQLAHCISMAVVPNVTLRQVHRGEKSMFKAVATGQAARAGVFAALLARAGMEGPHLPFEGKAGWCDHVAHNRFSLPALGGQGAAFKILDTRIKNRPAAGIAIASILAAEKLAPLDIKAVQSVSVEVHKVAYEHLAIGDGPWHPGTREAADHSAPFLVAITLRDGTVTLRSFNERHVGNPELRAFMQKITVAENPEFTRAYDSLPQQHRARVTVLMNDGQRLVGESGGDEDDLSAQRSEAQVVEKFRGLSEDVLGSKRVDAILDLLWNLEQVPDVAEIPAAFVMH